MNLKTHRDVLEKWQAGRLHATETLVSDGPIDPNRWLKIERSSSNDDDLRKYVREDGDLLKQQVECLSPHVMVCCNTWPLVKDVWSHAEQISELVHSIDDMLVLDFWHPANRYPDVMNYYTVALLLHRALYPC